MELNYLLNQKSSFTLFLAPPAWGKTSMLLELYQSHIQRMVFISPLRALANEFYVRASSGLKNVQLIEKFSDSKEIVSKFLLKKSGILITTPEVLNADFFHQVESMKDKPIFVLDEFHLYYHWGSKFRPILWEYCMGIANSGASILGLSATFNDELLNKWKSDFSLGMNNKFIINLGNHTLLNYPKRIHCFSKNQKNAINRRFMWEMRNKKSGRAVFFCQYREEVDRWMDWSRRNGVRAIGCKGGEVIQFINDLKENPAPECIFSTSALSHGVNLPKIEKVFINYDVKEKDFWIQMVGRGGRKGESYQVFTLNSHLMSKKAELDSLVRARARDYFIKLQLFLELV